MSLLELTDQEIKGYILRRLIGSGGFGVIYLADQPLLERTVAVKIIQPQYASNPEFVRRFAVEAQLVARLEHLHIVPLYDFWRDPSGAYLVMRYLRGGDLHTALNQQGAWSLPKAARMLDQIAAALTAAHRNGVVHQDVKPSNILLDEEGNGYLTDFGIAKDLLDATDEVTSKTSYGSPLYMAPESIMREPVSAQSDIYSLGIVLYQLLTGHIPFVDLETSAIIRHQINEPIPPVQFVRPELPQELNLVIRQATAKIPEARYLDALAFAADFRRVARLDGVDSSVATPAAPPAADAADEDDTQRTVELRTPGHATEPLSTGFEISNPYKGLRAFVEADAQDFYGREYLTQQLLTRLTDRKVNDHREEARFLAVVGPSGSGKSSVVRAGVIPALRDGHVPGSRRWFIMDMTLGGDPFGNLAETLLNVALEPPPDLLATLQADAAGLHKMLKAALPAQSFQLLLFIDQFEEIFTQVEDESVRECFLANLHYAVTAPDSSLRLIITLRADFYDRPLLYPAFGELVRQSTEIVMPLTTDELARAITMPVERIGYVVEADLVAAVVSDVQQQPGALPLLQYALTELFEQSNEDLVLTKEAYRASGGVVGALALRAEELFNRMDAPDQETARQLFLRLITLGEGSDDTRRRVHWSELLTIAPTMPAIIEHFARYRLLTTDHDPQTREPTVEVAHEALLQRWDRLHIWLNDNREGLLTQRRLAAAAREWQNQDGEPGFLAEGGRLAQFEELAARPGFVLNEIEQQYVQASVVRQQRQVKRRRRRNLLLAAVAAVAVVAALLAGWQATVAFQQRDRADEQTGLALSERDRANEQSALARSRELAVTALTNLDHLDRALLLGIEAWETAPTNAAHNSLLTALQAQPERIAYLPGHADRVRAVAYSPTDEIAITGAQDGTIILWNTATHSSLEGPIQAHTDSVNALAFHPAGNLFASASSDGTVQVWAAEANETFVNPVELAGQDLIHDDDAVWSVIFSPDGRYLAAGDDAGHIHLWDTATWELIAEPIAAHDYIVYGLDFSPDGQILVSAGGDNVLRLWDTGTLRPMGDPLTGHENWVFAVSFSPDGQLLASASADQTVRLWALAFDAAGNLQPDDIISQPMAGHDNWVRDVQFTPGGFGLVTAGEDGTVGLWDLNAGGMVGFYPVAAEPVWAVALSPAGDTLLAGSADHNASLWTMPNPFAYPPDHLLDRALTGPDNAVASLAFSLDGALLAAGESDPFAQPEDHAIWVWDMSTGEVVAELSGNGGPINDLVFAPTGTDLIAANADGTLHIWSDASGDAPRQTLTGHTASVFAVAVSPDGATIVSGADDSTLRRWNLAPDAAGFGPLGEPLTGHSDGVLAVAIDPAGEWIASGSRDGTIRLWNLVSGAAVGDPLTSHMDIVQTVAFSPDQPHVLASGGRDSTVRLWDVAAGTLLGTLTEPNDWVQRVAFSPDGTILAAALADGQVQLWSHTGDGRTWRPVGAPLARHYDRVNGLAFNPTASQLATGGQDQVILLWGVGGADWVTRACQIANRDLTPAEGNLYLPGLPLQATCAGRSLGD